MVYLSRTPRTSPARVRHAGLAEGLRASFGLWWTALPMMAIWAGIAFGVSKLWLYAWNDPQFLIGGGTQALEGAANEYRESHAELIRLGALTEGRHLLDPNLPGDIRRIYAESPWIREVDSIRRILPNRLEMHYRLRVPVAQVYDQGRYHPIDMDAHSLPVEALHGPMVGLPVIEAYGDTRFGPVPADGEAWTSRGVRDALGLVTTLWASPLAELSSPVAVVVGAGAYRDAQGVTHERRPQLDLRTMRGRTIRWGTFNAGELPDEMTSAEKLRILSDLLERDPAAPNGLGVHGRLIDVSTPVVTVTP